MRRPCDEQLMNMQRTCNEHVMEVTLEYSINPKFRKNPELLKSTMFSLSKVLRHVPVAIFNIGFRSHFR